MREGAELAKRLATAIRCAVVAAFVLAPFGACADEWSGVAKAYAAYANAGCAEAKAALSIIAKADATRQARRAAVTAERADWARRLSTAAARLDEIATARARETKTLDAAKAAPAKTEERLAKVRDQLHVLKAQAFGAPGADNLLLEKD